MSLKIEREDGEFKIFDFGYQRIEVRVSSIGSNKTLVFDSGNDIVSEMTLDQLAEVVDWVSCGEIKFAPTNKRYLELTKNEYLSLEDEYD